MIWFAVSAATASPVALVVTTPGVSLEGHHTLLQALRDEGMEVSIAALPCSGGSAALRDATRRHLLEAPVAGSRWASREGCGVDVDGEGPPGIECGMSYVPEAARRLLWFYTDQHGR